MASTQNVTVPVRLVADIPMAWRHHCGSLNEGRHVPGKTMCTGCRYEANSDEVEARYLLVEVPS